MANHNEALLRRFLEEGWNQGNIHIVDEFVAPYFVDHHIPPMLPVGPDGIKQWYDMVSAAFSNLHITIEDTITTADKVAARLTITADHTGEFAGAIATGRHVSVSSILIYHFKDGKMIEAWENFDALGLMQQIEAIPTPA